MLILKKQHACESGFGRPWDLCPAIAEANQQGFPQRIPICYCGLPALHAGAHVCGECGRRQDRKWDKKKLEFAELLTAADKVFLTETHIDWRK